MRRLGVIGWPVAHSRSPAMFEAAFAACGMEDWSYQRLPLPPELFEETVRALPASGFVGANVTIPHKQAALALADCASDAATAIGAANTLTFAPDGTIEAQNTDAPGLIAALDRLTGMPAHLSALVLGAGGSARAAVWGLLDAGAASVSVWNRTPERARELTGELGGLAVDRPVQADLLVNCTSVGLQRSATDEQALNQLGMTVDQVGSYAYVVDLVYNGEPTGSSGPAHPTPLLAAALHCGVPNLLSGLEVLVAQGALSFELWAGRPAPLEAMRRGAGL
ncbi:MAG TPA: shikimate dehydrogenase [Solirubrobacteraceae bacterium]|jgi:shikimate dehydrogenase|nr:shikimate dehydrogenase [Solirubrobacteraceae bacterium]